MRFRPMALVYRVIRRFEGVKALIASIEFFGGGFGFVGTWPLDWVPVPSGWPEVYALIMWTGLIMEGYHELADEATEAIEDGTIP